LSAIQIAGTGCFVPDHVIDNELIGSLVERYVPGKGARWAEEKLGIRERRFSVPLDLTTGYPIGECEEIRLAEQAALAAIDDAKVRAQDLAGLWYVSCTQSDADRHFSSMAHKLHRQLGLTPEAFALEMDAGCGGAVHAIATAVSQMQGAESGPVLVVAANAPSQYFRHWETYAESGAWLSMYLFGDGAGAIVLERNGGGRTCGGVLATYTAVDPSKPLMEFARPAGRMDAVYSIDGRGVALGFRGYARAALEALRCRHPFKLEDVRRFYFHQVNGIVLRSFVAELGIPEGRVAIHVDRYGNLASAATLVLLDEDIRNGAVARGDLCVICAVGAGAQYGALLLTI
jgi:3-oxoacyl-[acyl-carrier-protein] synthase-3